MWWDTYQMILMWRSQVFLLQAPKNANVISFMDGTREGRVDAMIRTDWLIALRPTEAQLQCFQGVLSPPVFSRVLNFLKSLLTSGMTHAKILPNLCNQRRPECWNMLQLIFWNDSLQIVALRLRLRPITPKLWGCSRECGEVGWEAQLP